MDLWIEELCSTHFINFKWIMKPRDISLSALKDHAYRMTVNIDDFPEKEGDVKVSLCCAEDKQLLVITTYNVKDDGACCSETSVRRILRIPYKCCPDRYWAFVADLTLYVGIIISDERINCSQISGRELINSTLGQFVPHADYLANHTPTQVSSRTDDVSSEHNLHEGGERALSSTAPHAFDHQPKLYQTETRINVSPGAFQNQTDQPAKVTTTANLVILPRSEGTQPTNPQDVAQQVGQVGSLKEATFSKEQMINIGDTMVKQPSPSGTVDYRSSADTHEISESTISIPSFVHGMQPHFATAQTSSTANEDVYMSPSAEVSGAVKDVIQTEEHVKPVRKVAGDLMKLMSKFGDGRSDDGRVIPPQPSPKKSSVTRVNRRSSSIQNQAHNARQSKDSDKQLPEEMQMSQLEAKADTDFKIENRPIELIKRPSQRRVSTIAPMKPQGMPINAGESVDNQTEESGVMRQAETKSIVMTNFPAQSLANATVSHQSDIIDYGRMETTIGYSTQLPGGSLNFPDEQLKTGLATEHGADMDDRNRTKAMRHAATSQEFTDSLMHFSTESKPDLSTATSVETVPFDSLSENLSASISNNRVENAAFSHPYEELEQSEMAHKFNESAFNTALNRAVHENEQDVLRITLDVSDFKADQLRMFLLGNEIHVKVAMQDLGGGTRELMKRYQLPANADFTKSSVLLTQFGILQIDVPLIRRDVGTSGFATPKPLQASTATDF